MVHLSRILRPLKAVSFNITLVFRVWMTRRKLIFPPPVCHRTKERSTNYSMEMQSLNINSFLTHDHRACETRIRNPKSRLIILKWNSGTEISKLKFWKRIYDFHCLTFLKNNTQISFSSLTERDWTNMTGVSMVKKNEKRYFQVKMRSKIFGNLISEIVLILKKSFHWIWKKCGQDFKKKREILI